MNKFRSWWIRNDVEISWAIIGALTAFGISDFAQGFWFSGVVSFFFAWLNYAFRAVR
jgi:hypothetical protein